MDLFVAEERVYWVIGEHVVHVEECVGVVVFFLVFLGVVCFVVIVFDGFAPRPVQGRDVVLHERVCNVG